MLPPSRRVHSLWPHARSVPGPVLAARFRGALSIWIAASSSRNVRAFTTAGTYLRLTGNRWQFGPLPKRVMGRHDFVESTEVLSPTNVRVFGIHYIGSIYKFNFVPFAASFDGRSWHAVRIRGVGGVEPRYLARRQCPQRQDGHD